jgi:hypothetical protein
MDDARIELGKRALAWMLAQQKHDRLADAYGETYRKWCQESVRLEQERDRILADLAALPPP